MDTAIIAANTDPRDEASETDLHKPLKTLSLVHPWAQKVGTTGTTMSDGTEKCSYPGNAATLKNEGRRRDQSQTR